MGAVALAGIALTASLAGTGISAYGQYQQGKAQERMAKFNAEVQKNEAERIRMETTESVRRRREENARAMARARARLGKAGVTMEGTPLETMADAASRLELQALDEARAGRVAASMRETQAGVTLWEGKQMMRGARIGAVGTGIGGMGQAGMHGLTLFNTRGTGGEG